MTEANPSGPALGDPESPTLVLEQRIHYGYSEPVTELRQRLRIVPPRAHGLQQRRRWRLAVKGVRTSSRRTFVDAFGNVTIDVHVPRIDDAVVFVLDVEAEPDRSGGPHETGFDRRYLQHTRLTAPDDAMIEMSTGIRGQDVATLCRRVHESISYEWGVTGTSTTASEALAGGGGVCQDYAHIMLTVCRIAGLAARYVSGHLRGEGGSHAWVEVLSPHPQRKDAWMVEGWDPTHDRRTTADYLVVATGRDYADAAPLTGSYSGGNAINTLAVDKRLDLT